MKNNSPLWELTDKFIHRAATSKLTEEKMQNFLFNSDMQMTDKNRPRNSFGLKLRNIFVGNQKIIPAPFFMALLLMSSFSNEALAWHINTFISDPCHEQITLGALGMAEGHWAQISQEPGKRLLEIFERRVKDHGVPDEPLTLSWIEHELSREGVHEQQSEARRYVLASFIAGVRAPDLEGHHPSNIMDLRNRSLRDGKQHEHTIRRSFDAPGEDGDISLLEDTRDWIINQADRAERAWHYNGLPVEKIRWFLHGYGEKQVKAFAPAYLLGRAAHCLQDSYTHTLRDENLRIITVLNYIDAVQPHYNYELDGLPHSHRLDQCNVAHDAFDRKRFAAAQKATQDYFFAVAGRLDPEIQDFPALEDVVSNIFEYRPGCNSNDYCGNEWLPYAQQKADGPYSWLGCNGHDTGTRGSRVPGMSLIIIWLYIKCRRPRK